MVRKEGEKGERREEGESEAEAKNESKLEARWKYFWHNKIWNQEAEARSFWRTTKKQVLSYNKFILILCTVIHRNNQFIDPELDAPPIDPHKSIQNNTTQHKTKHASEQ